MGKRFQNFFASGSAAFAKAISNANTGNNSKKVSDIIKKRRVLMWVMVCFLSLINRL